MNICRRAIFVSAIIASIFSINNRFIVYSQRVNIDRQFLNGGTIDTNNGVLVKKLPRQVLKTNRRRSFYN